MNYDQLPLSDRETKPLPLLLLLLLLLHIHCSTWLYGRTDGLHW